MDNIVDVVEALTIRGETLAVAESFTGGLVMDSITQVAGASVVFLGGVVAYADEVKTAMLGVPKGVLRRHGAVSREAASSMASAARRVFGADWGLSTTGIAGPGGATPGKPVGLCFSACMGPSDARPTVVRSSLHGPRQEIKRLGAVQALESLMQRLGD